MKKLVPLALAVSLAALASGPALGQGQDFSKVEIKATDLGHNIYMLQGAGGNMTAAVGSDGVILVDAEFAPLHAKIKAAIQKISPLPIKYLINTHYHIDHTGGNEAFGKEGVIIVAHENLAKRLAVPPPSATGRQAPPAPKAAMPAQTYNDQGTEVKIAGQTAELIHIEHAHTDGDTMVFWKDADIISSGDIVGSAAYPGIDVAADGSIGGMIDGAQFIVDHSDAQTKIVPGHGPLIDRKGIDRKSVV